MAEDGISQAIALIKLHKWDAAKKILSEIVSKDQNNEAAWLWLAACVNTDDLKKLCLKNVLEINPRNIIAKEALVKLKPLISIEDISLEILFANQGLGPLQPLLDDENISEVMINGERQIFVEKSGKREKITFKIETNTQVIRLIERILSPLGLEINEKTPCVDARLSDGSRINAIIPPISLSGPILTIRKFSKKPFSVKQILELGTATPEIMQFLEACVKARINLIISGGNSAGKTSFLNVLAGFIPNEDRIVTIENAAELQLHQEHVITLETRSPDIEGKGEVSIRQLINNTLRMHPDRIIVGEISNEAVIDMLQAMNTGHDGSMTTCYSNGPRDTLYRLEAMMMMAGKDLPIRYIHESISLGINLIIHLERLKDGLRRISKISEISGMQGEVIGMTDLFIFEQMGVENGRIRGVFRGTGMRPKFTEKLEKAGIHLSQNVFSTKGIVT